MRAPTAWRGTFAALAMLALAFKLLIPSGFMPGTSLSAPVVLCPGQGAMPGMMPMSGNSHHHDPARTPHGAPEHQCSFAGTGAAALVAPLDAPPLLIAVVPVQFVVASLAVATPGRGLAAPPPPSHAPPAVRA